MRQTVPTTLISLEDRSKVRFTYSLIKLIISRISSHLITQCSAKSIGSIHLWVQFLCVNYAFGLYSRLCPPTLREIPKNRVKPRLCRCWLPRDILRIVWAALQTTITISCSANSTIIIFKSRAVAVIRLSCRSHWTLPCPSSSPRPPHPRSFPATCWAITTTTAAAVATTIKVRGQFKLFLGN